MTALLGYARVSTQSQELQPQRDRLGAPGCVRVFEDVVSGRSFDRPGLTALLDYARPGDAVCVVRLDRLGRSLRELLDTVQLLRDRGVGFVSLEEKLDTASAAGELVFHVFWSIAHFERRLIAERTRDGLSPTRAAAQVGLGRSTVYRELQHTLPAPPAAYNAERN